MLTLKRCRRCRFMFLRARRRSSLLCRLAVNQVCFSAWLAVNRLDGLVVSSSLTRLFALHHPSHISNRTITTITAHCGTVLQGSLVVGTGWPLRETGRPHWALCTAQSQPVSGHSSRRGSHGCSDRQTEPAEGGHMAAAIGKQSQQKGLTWLN